MKNNSRLSQWQIVLIVLGLSFILGPMIWDSLNEAVKAISNTSLNDILSRGGFIVIGIILLAIAAIYEFVKDETSNPKSKHIR